MPDKEINKRELNLFQKLAAITGEVGIIKKDGTNTEQHYSFIEYAAVAGRLRDLFADYGIVIVPYMAKASNQTRTEFSSRNGAKGTAVLIDFTFVVYNADKPEEKISVTWVGEAADYGDKATNKAATAALKYYLMRQFNISEKGEDPDAESPETAGATATTTKKVLAGPISDQQRKLIFVLLKRAGIDDAEVQKATLRINGIPDPKNITKQQASDMIEKLQSNSFARPDEDQTPPEETPPAKPDTVIEDVDDIDLEASLDEAANGIEEETFLVTDDIKEDITSRLDSLGLSGTGRIRLLKSINDKATTPKQLTDGDWMKLDQKLQSVIKEEEKLPEDWFPKETTPKTKSTNAQGVDNGSDDIKDD